MEANEAHELHEHAEHVAHDVHRLEQRHAALQEGRERAREAGDREHASLAARQLSGGAVCATPNRQFTGDPSTLNGVLSGDQCFGGG